MVHGITAKKKLIQEIDAYKIKKSWGKNSEITVRINQYFLQTITFQNVMC